jgi:hypothetical protein
MDLCSTKPKFDPDGDIETLLLGAEANPDHPGREALENHMRTALAYPAPPDGIECGSAMGKRAHALLGATARSADIEIGFLDLLIHMPAADARLPKKSKTNPVDSMIDGFQAIWGSQLVFCGVVDESQWDTYIERASAVMALIERSLIGESSGASALRGNDSRL